MDHICQPWRTKSGTNYAQIVLFAWHNSFVSYDYILAIDFAGVLYYISLNRNCGCQ